MKTFLYSFVIIIAILLNVSSASAQLKGLLRDMATEAMGSQDDSNNEDKSDEKQSDNNQKQSKNPNFLERKMMSVMGLNNVKYDQSYSFSSSMIMEVEAIDSLKNKENIKYETFYNPSNKSYAMVFEGVDSNTGKKQKSTMIFDMKNYAMLILAEKDGERSGVAISIPPDSTEVDEPITEEVEEYSEDFVHPFYSPTGRTKNIAGFSCKEYTYKSNEGSVDLWVTNDKKVNISKAYDHMSGLQSLANVGWAYGMGTVMELVHNDKLSGTSSHMLVKEINPEKKQNIDISGYQIVGVGGAQ